MKSKALAGTFNMKEILVGTFSNHRYSIEYWSKLRNSSLHQTLGGEAAVGPRAGVFGQLVLAEEGVVVAGV